MELTQDNQYSCIVIVQLNSNISIPKLCISKYNYADYKDYAHLDNKVYTQ